ncbi:hypothetical protein FQR65_LT09792 [Abscondita terminalis]|nr:hypothetical protein FQR65_LT09792 [Abscondita terminalis]
MEGGGMGDGANSGDEYRKCRELEDILLNNSEIPKVGGFEGSDTDISDRLSEHTDHDSDSEELHDVSISDDFEAPRKSSNETNYTPIQSPASFENNVCTSQSLVACSNTPSVRSSFSNTRKRCIKNKVDEVLDKVNTELDINIKEDNLDVIRELSRDAALMAKKIYL